MVLCLLCQNKIEVIRIKATSGGNDFDKCFFTNKKSSRGSPAHNSFLKFVQCSGSLKRGSGSGHKGRDPDAKCFFSNKKSSRGPPAHNSFLIFVQCFYRQFQQRGIRIQAQFFNKCFSVIKKSSRGPPALGRFLKSFQCF